MGGFTCQCNEGYNGDGVSCFGRLFVMVCYISVLIFRWFLTKAISCPKMFAQLFSSVDIDECASNLDNCASNSARCANLDGGYMCQCSEGYTGDGISCTGRLFYILLCLISSGPWYKIYQLRIQSCTPFRH